MNAPPTKNNTTNAAFEHGHQLLFLFWVRIFLHISKVFRYFQKIITQESNNWMARRTYRTLQDGVYSRTKRATHKTSLSLFPLYWLYWLVHTTSLHLHVSSVAERGQCSSQVFVSLAIQGIRRCPPKLDINKSGRFLSYPIILKSNILIGGPSFGDTT